MSKTLVNKVEGRDESCNYLNDTFLFLAHVPFKNDKSSVEIGHI